MARPTLDEILSDDSDLLDVKPGSNVALTEHQCVIDSLHKVCDRLPGRSRGLGPIRFPRRRLFYVASLSFARSLMQAARCFLYNSNQRA
jgi:hypothetical protein